MKYIMTLIVCATILAGCTHQQIYNATQTSQKNECEKLQLQQREDCLKHLAPEYNEYERERKKLNQK